MLELQDDCLDVGDVGIRLWLLLMVRRQRFNCCSRLMPPPVAMPPPPMTQMPPLVGGPPHRWCRTRSRCLRNRSLRQLARATARS